VLLDGVSCADACDANAMCVVGVCEPATPIDCDDSNPCTADSCDSVTGCVNEPILACGGPVPTTPGWGLALLTSLLLVAGALLVRERRRMAA
jgi:hypothetical protein